MDIAELVHPASAADPPARPIPKMRGGPGKRYACDFAGCRSSFTRNSDLTRHLKIHQGIRPHRCNVPGCSKYFSQRSALTVHIRTHTGERPHKCEECAQSFTDSSSLVRHRRMHTGELAFVCTIGNCDQAYARKITLNKHMTRVHGGIPALPYTPGKLGPAMRSASPYRTRSPSFSFSDEDSSDPPSPMPSLDDRSEDDGLVDVMAYCPSPAPSVASAPAPVRPSLRVRRGPVVGIDITLPPTGNGLLAAPPMPRSTSTWSDPGCLQSPTTSSPPSIEPMFAAGSPPPGLRPLPAQAQTPSRPAFNLSPLASIPFPSFLPSPIVTYAWPTPQSPRTTGRFEPDSYMALPPPISPTTPWFVGPTPVRLGFAFRAAQFNPLSPTTPSYTSIYRRNVPDDMFLPSPSYAPWATSSRC